MEFVRLYLIKASNQSNICLPSNLNAPDVPSIIFPHHPEGQGTTWIPCCDSSSVTFIGNGSRQDPNSPLERHLIHLLLKPEII